MACLDCGTAFAFGSQYLLTARHNIEPFPESREKKSLTGVWLTDADGEMDERLGVVHIDEDLDIAILKAHKTKFRRLALDLRDPLPYSKAYALQLLNSPPAVYSGRVLPGQPRRFEQHIDTPVACGFSGGPVLSIDGTVLGLITMIKVSPTRRCTYLRTSALIYILQILGKSYIKYKKWAIKAVIARQGPVNILQSTVPAQPPAPSTATQALYRAQRIAIFFLGRGCARTARRS